MKIRVQKIGIFQKTSTGSLITGLFFRISI